MKEEEEGSSVRTKSQRCFLTNQEYKAGERCIKENDGALCPNKDKEKVLEST